LRIIYIFFHNGCANLHFHQQCMRASFPWTSLLALVIFHLFLTIAILKDMILICISLMISDFFSFFCISFGYLYVFFWDNISQNICSSNMKKDMVVDLVFFLYLTINSIYPNISQMYNNIFNSHKPYEIDIISAFTNWSGLHTCTTVF
jgi:hypothetical protein